MAERIEPRLEALHRAVGEVHCAIVIALVKRGVRGGTSAIREWAKELRRIADEVEHLAQDLEEQQLTRKQGLHGQQR